MRRADPMNGEGRPNVTDVDNLGDEDLFLRVCKNCGLTWGAHRANSPTGDCPGHEGKMDWDKGPGTTFDWSGDVAIVPDGTPAKGARV